MKWSRHLQKILRRKPDEPTAAATIAAGRVKIPCMIQAFPDSQAMTGYFYAVEVTAADGRPVSLPYVESRVVTPARPTHFVREVPGVYAVDVVDVARGRDAYLVVTAKTATDKAFTCVVIDAASVVP